MSSKEEELDLSVPSPNYSSDDSSEESQRRKSSLRLVYYLTGIVVQNISNLSSQHGHVNDVFESLYTIGIPIEDISKLIKDNDKIRNSFQALVSLGQELKVFFAVPNQQMSYNSLDLNSNDVVAAFINFLLQMVEAILYFEADSLACVKGSIQNLQTELGFLITFLGDTVMHLQPTKNIVIDIEAMVNEVGSFLYSFFFTIILFAITRKKGTSNTITDFEAVVSEVGSLLHGKFFDLLEDIPLQTTTKVEGNKMKGKMVEDTKNAMTDIKALVHEVESFIEPFIFEWDSQVPESGRLGFALSNLLTKFELLKTKIKEHCIAVSKMPSDMAPKTAVASLFIVDSILNDLMYTMNNNSDKIIGVKDQIIVLHKELMSLGSSITDIAVQHETGHEKIMIQTRDIAYEVEYVINSFPHVWYLTLRLSQLIEKIQLIMMYIKEIRNNN